MIAAIFPGQGSQQVGMAQDLLEDAAGRAVLEQAFRVLPQLETIMFEGPIEVLTQTEHAQPALVAAGVAAFAAFQAATAFEPSYVAGHSLGEFTAHVVAGSLEFEDALRLVHLRGQAMQRAVPLGEGAMAAVMRLSPALIAEIVAAEGAEVANFNAPEQTVISGSFASVTVASEALRAKGARVVPLNVSAPFHSSLMQPARLELEAALARIPWREPKLPVIANVTAQPVSQAASISALLGEQVTASVRWVESVETLARLGVRQFFEFGPGTVLTGLVKRIIPEAQTVNIATRADIRAFTEVGHV